MDIAAALETQELKLKAKITVSTTEVARLQHMQHPDRALDFLTRTGYNNTTMCYIDLQAVRWKVDWHLVPLMFLCYSAQFVDKVALNVGYVFLLRPLTGKLTIASSMRQ